MYSFLLPETKPQPVDAFDWFVYSNKAPVTINANLKIEKGARFGVAKCDDPRMVKLVMAGNLARVFTVKMEKARLIARGIK